MLNLTCGAFSVPLMCVQSISWQKKSRLVTHVGGYVSSRGYEPAEISVKIQVNYTILKQLGMDADSIYSTIRDVVTDRKSISGVFYIGGYPIYPELEFTPTNINKTYITDTAKTGIIDVDMVFSGVKCVKEVVRERALELDPVLAIPELVLSVGEKELVIQDSLSLNEFVTQPDSITFTLSIGSDMDLVSRDGFLDALLENGVVTADLPQGKTKYYIVDASLVEEQLSVTGSIYPRQALKVLTRTYQDTSLKAILEDLANEAGIDIICKTDGDISYYCAFGNPVQCIKELQTSAGFIMSYRQGKLTCVNVPEYIDGQQELEYLEITQDSGTEPLRGVYWFDGVNQITAGVLDATAQKIYSVFRSNDKSYADRCLKFMQYQGKVISVSTDIEQNIDSHSAVWVRSNDKEIQCVVEWYELDWLNNTARYELHYV